MAIGALVPSIIAIRRTGSASRWASTAIANGTLICLVLWLLILRRYGGLGLRRLLWGLLLLRVLLCGLHGSNHCIPLIWRHAKLDKLLEQLQVLLDFDRIVSNIGRDDRRQLIRLVSGHLLTAVLHDRR